MFSKILIVCTGNICRSPAAEGLLKRAEHTKDPRAKSVELTEKGQYLARTLVPIVEKIDAQYFAGLNHSDQQTLIQVLAKLIEKQDWLDSVFLIY